MFDDINTRFETLDFTIQGKMVICRMRVPDLHMRTMDPNFKDSIKNQMASNIAHFMLDNNMIEYTQIRDHASFDTLINARCFVTPDEQVRLLRTMKR